MAVLVFMFVNSVWLTYNARGAGFGPPGTHRLTKLHCVCGDKRVLTLFQGNFVFNRVVATDLILC